MVLKGDFVVSSPALILVCIYIVWRSGRLVWVLGLWCGRVRVRALSETVTV